MSDEPQRYLSTLFQRGTSPELERLQAESIAAELERDGRTAAISKLWRKAEKDYAAGNHKLALAGIQRWIDLIDKDHQYEQAQNDRATAQMREKLRVLTELWKMEERIP